MFQKAIAEKKDFMMMVQGFGKRIIMRLDTEYESASPVDIIRKVLIIRSLNLDNYKNSIAKLEKFW